MAVGDKLYTVDDLIKLSAANDSKRYELVRGVLIEMAPTGETHGILVNEIAYAITSFVRAGNLGRVLAAETGFLLSEDPAIFRAPDVAFTSSGRVQPRTEKYPTVAPDLAVEVISPGDSQSEMHEKVVDYFRAGTRLVWIVYPRSRAIYVYQAPTQITVLGSDDTLDGGDVLPGFQAKVGDLFAVLDS